MRKARAKLPKGAFSPGAGAYICGEETGLIESLEGKRAYPRIKPPFPAVHGLFGCPTIVNNVETLACVKHVIEKGAAWFKAIGPDSGPGPKLYCVSGHVNEPGLYELPMGTSLREIIEVHANLDEHPEWINEDPYGRGWIVCIAPEDLDQIETLLSPEEYLKHIEERTAS